MLLIFVLLTVKVYQIVQATSLMGVKMEKTKEDKMMTWQALCVESCIGRNILVN